MVQFLRVQTDSAIDPVFYIPLRDIQNGPAEISNHEESNFGYWNATVTLGDYQFEVAGFHSGPLEDLVKVPVESIGKLMLTGRGTVQIRSHAY